MKTLFYEPKLHEYNELFAGLDQNQYFVHILKSCNRYHVDISYYILNFSNSSKNQSNLNDELSIEAELVCKRIVT